MMTLTPSRSKEKQKTPEGLGIPTDWCIHAIDQPTEESLAVLDLPFETIPESKDTVPSKFTEQVCHLVGGQSIAVHIDGKEVFKKHHSLATMLVSKELFLHSQTSMESGLKSDSMQETNMNASAWHDQVFNSKTSL